MKFIQGNTYKLKVTLTGAIFGTPTISVDKPEQIDVSLSADGLTVSFAPKVDNTVEDFAITWQAQNDPNDTSKVLKLTFSGTDALKAATQGSLDLVAG